MNKPDSLVHEKYTEELVNLEFIYQYEQQIRDACNIAGLEISSEATMADIATKLQSFARGDHFSPQLKLELPDSSTAQALKLFSEIGMVDEVQPEPGSYDRIVVLGGIHVSNQHRLEFLRKYLDSGRITLADDGKIIMLGGNRILEDSEKYVMQIGETEAASLGYELQKQLGDQVLRQMHLRVGLLNRGDDVIQRRIFDGASYRTEIINANPVHRKQGKARHTTQSTAEEWLSSDFLPDNADILFISSNPYIYRTSQDTLSVINKHAINPRLVACGPAALNDMLLQRCYGELARITYCYAGVDS